MSDIDTSAEAVERMAHWIEEHPFGCQIAATLRALAAERDALREALSALLDACELRANREGGDFGPEIGPAAERAAAALRAMAEEAGHE